MVTAKQIIKFFGMRPLTDEGGYYVETYRALEKITPAALRKESLGLPVRYTSERNFATAILYLLTPDTFSSLHRLAGDEIYHFYLGSPVTMLQLHPDGSSEVITLGQDILNGQCVQTVVPQSAWQGCFLSEGGEFALMGCTVTPGFEFNDLEPGRREELLEQYPDRRDLILKLT
jgi:predicted cupin superfamily sugar epimerase